MDDGVFERNTSMSAADIDNWLNANFSSGCISPSTGFTTPDPQGWSDANYKYMYGGNVTAGTAIYDAAQLYHMNPQVILSTLQKEQSIVSGSAGCHNYPDPNAPYSSTPNSSSTFTCNIRGSTLCTYACIYAGGCMNIAEGYDCPGYCRVSSEGFNAQITLGTWIQRFGEKRAYGTMTGYPGYETGDETNYYSGPMTQGYRQRISGGQTFYFDGTWTSNDGTGVMISNGATASLYNYTPFTSGNSNFDTIFQNWFGSIYDQFTWAPQSQYAYTDNTKTTPVDLTNLLPGQKVYIGFTAKNTGDVTWSNSGSNPIHVGTSSPQDRNSSFCDISDNPAWLGCSRAANMTESSVAPGQIGTFEFWYKVPGQTGTYDEHFNLVAEGLKWMEDPGLYFHTVVKQPTYTWSLQSQYAYTDNTKTTSVDLTKLTAGQKVFIGFTALNTGNVAWSNTGSSPVHAGTSSPLDRSSSFCDTSWISCNRPANLSESSVAPGQTGTFEFWYQAPGRTGVYQEHFRPVVEGVTWMNDIGLSYYTVVHFDTSGGNTVGPNSQLSAGQSITTSNGNYRLILQGDGNLVLYSINRAIWSSGTTGNPITKAIMQSDGNFVLYDSQFKPYWSTNTAGKGTSSLIVQNDGNLVIYNSSQATWNTRTNGQF